MAKKFELLERISSDSRGRLKMCESGRRASYYKTGLCMGLARYAETWLPLEIPLMLGNSAMVGDTLN
jgi:hypothetical protein